ncbi:OmpA family protein [Phaeodactylibacter luteus]|uniref:OmpA family protein n=1 Tax=Phaeodactylibacter luteus TaxID=1564516 RepID=A0A5C6RJF9_9BACT|nr:OmpA family protein [Phaeodactylibacter luteus]TXB62064.1 OmpA family protein [Phaeodactylibacter luteus]
MKKISSAFFALAIALGMSSCVSYQKYEDTLAERDKLQANYQDLETQLASSAESNRGLREENQSLSKRLAEAEQDLRTSRDRYSRLEKSNEDLMKRYDRMLEQNQQMLESSSDERKQLMAQLTLKEQELNRREQQLRQLEQAIEEKEADVEALRQGLVEREARVNELEEAIAAKEAKLNTLRERINQALLGFSDADLSVREENGKVYVSLSQNLLFRSGSKTINTEGKDAIRKVAAVLKSNPDIGITVEGHTDTDGEAAFNWDLSVGRATSVVKVITDEGVDPARITAAGRGEFYPIASNDTAEGKAKNRRTEIILTPKLDALYQLIEE